MKKCGGGGNKEVPSKVALYVTGICHDNLWTTQGWEEWLYFMHHGPPNRIIKVCFQCF